MPLRLLALLLVLTAAPSLLAQECRAPVKELVKDKDRWQRFVFGMQEVHARNYLVAPNASKNPDVAKALTAQGKSCASVAYALDYVFRKTETKLAALTLDFTKTDFLRRVQEATTQRKQVLFHFRIPEAVRLGAKPSDNLGHHFVLEWDGKTGSGTVYMAFEQKFTLGEWLTKTGAPKGNAEAGGAVLKFAQVQTWAADLDHLLENLRATAKPGGDSAAWLAASQLSKRLFSVSFPEMGFPAKNGKAENGADSVKIVYGQFDYTPANCKATVAQIKKVKPFTCSGAVCG